MFPSRDLTSDLIQVKIEGIKTIKISKKKINIRDTSSWAERIEHKKLSGSRKKPSMKTYD